jgi:hypothetical protein
MPLDSTSVQKRVVMSQPTRELQLQGRAILSFLEMK